MYGISLLPKHIYSVCLTNFNLLLKFRGQRSICLKVIRFLPLHWTIDLFVTSCRRRFSDNNNLEPQVKSRVWGPSYMSRLLHLLLKVLWQIGVRLKKESRVANNRNCRGLSVPRRIRLYTTRFKISRRINDPNEKRRAPESTSHNFGMLGEYHSPP